MKTRRGKKRARRRFRAWLRSLGMIGPLAACTANNNNAVGEINGPEAESAAETLALQWQSDGVDPERGQISGTAPDGTRFTGRYIEVSPNVEEHFYKVAWEGWEPYWSAWAWDGDAETMDWARFVDTFTGTVIANLLSDDGQTRLRCRFIIDTPMTGLEGSDSGLCELSDGDTINAVVLAPQ